jgi:hypothetical protein
VLLAGELEPFHLRVPEVERMAAQLPSQRRSPRTVQGIVVIVEPHGIVKEGEQEHERRVGVGHLRKEGESAVPARAGRPARSGSPGWVHWLAGKAPWSRETFHGEWRKV